MKNAMKARLESIQSKTGTMAKKASHLALVGGTAMYAGAANAALDVTAASTAIEGQSANVETIALSVLGVLAVIAGVSYLRRVIK